MALIKDKIFKMQLKWFDHVKRRSTNALVRRVDGIEEVFSKWGRGRPKGLKKKTLVGNS